MTGTVAGTDCVRRLLFEELDIRGALVQLHGCWQRMHAGRDYAEVVRRTLGEMTAVTALIACNLKQPGRLTFQAQGDGPVSLLVIDCTADLHLRGMAKAAPDIRASSVLALLGTGKLVLTLQPESAEQTYQSIVPLQGETVASVFEHFLAQSEQQPTRLLLSASATTAAGLFLQKMPGADQRDPDGWLRLQHLAATIAARELEQLPPKELLAKVFANETVRLFDAQPLAYDCPENPDKVRAMLRSLGREEVDAILREHGEVVVRDDMCNHVYRFDAAAIDEIFGDSTTPAKKTLH